MPCTPSFAGFTGSKVQILTRHVHIPEPEAAPAAQLGGIDPFLSLVSCDHATAEKTKRCRESVEELQELHGGGDTAVGDAGASGCALHTFLYWLYWIKSTNTDAARTHVRDSSFAPSERRLKWRQSWTDMEASKRSRWEATQTSPTFPPTAPILPLELAAWSSIINQAEVAMCHVPKPTTYKEKGSPKLGNVVGGSCGGS